MRLAVFSDVHADLAALELVLEVAARLGAEVYCCVGDLVGYGERPAECVALVRERCAVVVRGNHDEAVGTGEGIRMLPWRGRRAARRHRRILSQEDRAWLAGLPLVVEAFGCTFVHATPHRPEAWLRLRGYQATQAQFAHFGTDVCFVGHTHVAGVAADGPGVAEVRRGHRYLINVGSVGQPRDGDPRPCLGIFDTETFAYALHRPTG